ncbi:hypothetical protein [Shewanella maritima]|uniref:hypothetical protein n=1 Tax=Shewanella maritima TaxID=2520507 RepID=UPI0037354297
MKVFGILIQVMLWLAVAFSPTLIGVFIGFFVHVNSSGSIGEFALPSFALLGFLAGGLWAERIRKHVGLSEFMGHLVKQPEIDSEKTS